MILPVIPTPLVLPILVASTHGLQDIQEHPPLRLSIYTLAAAPLPHVTPLFLLASIRHFSHDIGAQGSTILHLLWLSLYLFQCSTVAWWCFCVFYVCVHSFPRLCVWFERSRAQVGTVVTIALFAKFYFVRSLMVNETLQKIMLMHIVLDEVKSI